MKPYVILSIDDEKEVLDSVLLDLEPFASKFDIEAAQSVAEARELIAELEAEGKSLALVLCDHIMPNELGVDFLIELNKNESQTAAKKILLTGQAGLDATIEAVNNGGLDYFIAKPWQASALQETVKQQLTQFIIDNEPESLPYAQLLDAQAIFSAISQNRLSV